MWTKVSNHVKIEAGESICKCVLSTWNPVRCNKDIMTSGHEKYMFKGVHGRATDSALVEAIVYDLAVCVDIEVGFFPMWGPDLKC